MTEDSLTIKIEVLQRPYSVRVQRQDEELFRQAGDLIETSIQRYASKGVYRDKQDLLAMALLEIAVMNFKNKQKEDVLSYTEDEMHKLNGLNDFLSEHIDDL